MLPHVSRMPRAQVPKGRENAAPGESANPGSGIRKNPSPGRGGRAGKPLKASPGVKAGSRHASRLPPAVIGHTADQSHPVGEAVSPSFVPPGLRFLGLFSPGFADSPRAVLCRRSAAAPGCSIRPRRWLSSPRAVLCRRSAAAPDVAACQPNSPGASPEGTTECSPG